jgi:hypothetical protein
MDNLYTIRANRLKGRGAKLQGLDPKGHGSQLPKEVFCLNRKLTLLRYTSVILAVILALFGGVSTAHHGPSSQESGDTGESLQIIENERASADISDLNHGIVRVKYNQTQSPKKLKVIIEKDKERYIYDLNSQGAFEPYPLQMGSGRYSLRVLTNIVDNRYAAIFGTSLDVELADQKAPFLAASQMVRFDEAPKTVELAKELAKDAATDKEKLEAISSYIINNISYDWDKARTVKPGYLPDCDEILEAGKGICFDYSSLLASMLRSLDVPTKLVTGYVAPDYLYHAWNEVYIEGTGWVRINRFYSTYKEGEGWMRMDPTFAASMKGSSRVSSFIENEDNYKKKLEY